MKRTFDPARKLADYLADTLGYDDERRLVMAYGLGALFQMLLLLVCSLCFGLLANCLAEAMLLFWGVGLLRRATGGAHCHTYLGCILTSLTAICGLAAVCRYVVPTDAPRILYGAVGILPAYLVLFGVVWKKAPKASVNKPITNPAKISRLRRQSFITVGIYLAAAVWMLYRSRELPQLIHSMSALVAVAWWSALMLTDFAEVLVRGVDRAVQFH